MTNFRTRLAEHPEKNYPGVLHNNILSSFFTKRWLNSMKNILVECGVPGAFTTIRETDASHLRNFAEIHLKKIAIYCWRISKKQSVLCQGYILHKNGLSIKVSWRQKTSSNSVVHSDIFFFSIDGNNAKKWRLRHRKTWRSATQKYGLFKIFFRYLRNKKIVLWIFRRLFANTSKHFGYWAVKHCEIWPTNESQLAFLTL